MFMSKLLVFSALLAVLISVVSGAQHFPALLWSGKEIFDSKYKHFSACTTRGLTRTINNAVFAEEAENPEVFVAFLHPELSSNEFLQHGNKNGAFDNLKAYVTSEAKSSMVFPTCKPQNTFSSFLNEVVAEKNDVNTLVVRQSGEADASLDTFAADVKSFIKKGKQNFFIVNFDKHNHPSKDAVEYLKETDAVMKQIVSAIEQETSGNYVALLSSDHATPMVARKLMAGPGSKTYVNPWAPITKDTTFNLTVTPYILATIITMAIFVAPAYVVFMRLHNVKTAPHIVTDFNKRM